MNCESSDAELVAVRQLLKEARLEASYERARRLADAGSVEAQLFVGMMHQKGKGVSKDLSEAERWYTKAMRPGSGSAEFRLAWLAWQRNELGTMVSWLEASATKGSAAAQYELARLYSYGFAVEKDSNKGHHHMAEAAQRGHFFARAALARELLKGKRGWHRIPSGLVLFVRTVLTEAKLKLRRPHDDTRVTFQRLTQEDI